MMRIIIMGHECKGRSDLGESSGGGGGKEGILGDEVHSIDINIIYMYVKTA
jgi:hypothetical protein